jgi:pimeloyl-ACP methyl ester carboxylesterase
VVLLHGYTNNPRQYAELGPLLHEDGHNVIAPRFPYHGYRDRMTTEIAAMRFEDWVPTALDAAALATALGERVTVFGISVAGTIAGWLASYLPIDVGIGLSPFVGVRFFNPWSNAVLAKAMRTVPDQFVWWDPTREAAQLPFHAYPRFSLHTLGETLRFGETFTSCRSDAHGRRALLLLNAHEPIVNNALARERFAVLRERGVEVDTIERSDFPPRHDVIDPALPGGADPAVYALVRELIGTS